MINTAQLHNKTYPQTVGGTITISNGEEIHIEPGSIQNNESTKSSAVFIKELTKAIKEGVFQSEDEEKRASKSAK